MGTARGRRMSRRIVLAAAIVLAGTLPVRRTRRRPAGARHRCRHAGRDGVRRARIATSRCKRRAQPSSRKRRGAVAAWSATCDCPARSRSPLSPTTARPAGSRRRGNARPDPAAARLPACATRPSRWSRPRRLRDAHVHAARRLQLRRDLAGTARTMFLIQYTSAVDPTRYAVRAYDLAPGGCCRARSSTRANAGMRCAARRSPARQPRRPLGLHALRRRGRNAVRARARHARGRRAASTCRCSWASATCGSCGFRRRRTAQPCALAQAASTLAVISTVGFHVSIPPPAATGSSPDRSWPIFGAAVLGGDPARGGIHGRHPAAARATGRRLKSTWARPRCRVAVASEGSCGPRLPRSRTGRTRARQQ